MNSKATLSGCKFSLVGVIGQALGLKAFDPLYLRKKFLDGLPTAFYSAVNLTAPQQQLFKSQASAQRFLTTHAAIYNTFNIQRRLISRPTLRRFRADAATAWAAAVA